MQWFLRQLLLYILYPLKHCLQLFLSYGEEEAEMASLFFQQAITIYALNQIKLQLSLKINQPTKGILSFMLVVGYIFGGMFYLFGAENFLIRFFSYFFGLILVIMIMLDWNLGKGYLKRSFSFQQKNNRPERVNPSSRPIMICRSCSTENRAEDQFCMECGINLHQSSSSKQSAKKT